MGSRRWKRVCLGVKWDPGGGNGYVGVEMGSRRWKRVCLGVKWDPGGGDGYV